MLYHYCSNGTFLSIIKNKSIWLSDLTLSNDRLEGKWVRNLLVERCENEGMHPVELERLLSAFDFGAERMGAAGFCMSEDGDLLSQWRGYAADGAGVSVGFEPGYLEQVVDAHFAQRLGDALSLHKVAYSREDQMALVQTSLDEAVQAIKAGALDQGGLLSPLEGDRKTEVERQHRLLLASLLSIHLGQFRMKNPAFSEEREWRLISLVLSFAQEGADHGDLSRMEFRNGGDRVIPYRVVPIDTTGIREVVLGPKNITPKRYVTAALARYNWENVSVKVSAASYR
jgi:hypothetical protein